VSDISAITSTTPTTPAAGFQSTALAGIDKEMFLKLLVAQMQYQNPMNPVDSSEFLNQAAQYASVEQLENLATSQAEVRALQMITVASDMVGNEVIATDPATGEPLIGIVDSVQFGGAEPLIVIAGVAVPVTAVSEMRRPLQGPAADTATGAAATTPATTTEPAEVAA
jgi:flagellar basal-body rod modification protein FlgD